MNFHEFIPDATSAKSFSALLKENPVTPYLDSRRDFMIWTNHIHNLMNERLDKDNVPFEKYETDFDEYRSKQYQKRDGSKVLIYLVFIALLILVAVSVK